MVYFGFRFASVLLATTLLLAQVPSRPHVFQEFASQDQLRIQDAATDPAGLVWLADASGVFRFDGLRYLRIPGYPFSQATFIAAPPGGIWVGGPSGLAQFRNSRWEVLSSTPVTAWQRTPAGFWAATTNSLELRNGNGRVVKSLPPPTPQTKLALSQNRLWLLREQRVCSLPSDGSGELSCESTPAPPDWLRAFRDAQGKLWGVDQNRVTTTNPSHSVPSTDYPVGQSNPFLSPAGRPWWVRSFSPLPSVPQWHSNPLSDTCELFTSESTRWICADNRLAYSRLDENWEYWSDRSAAGAKAFFFDPRSKATLLYGRNGIARLDPNSRHWERLPQLPSLDVRALLDDGFGGYWIATMERALLRIDAAGKVLEQLHPCPSADTYRLLYRDHAGRLWIGGKDIACFYELSGRPNAWKLTPQNLPGNSIQAIAVAEDPEKKLWVGYEDGLRWRDQQGQWQPIATSEPLRLIRDFVFESPDVLWVVHRQLEYFTRAQRNGDTWQVTRFPHATYPGDSHFLQRDSRGWLWRGAEGSTWVAQPRRTGPADWLRLDKRSGIPIGDAHVGGFAEDPTGTVWLAGAEGILRLKPDPSWFQAPATAAPRPSRVTIPGQEWLDPATLPTEFPAGVAEIAVEWSTIGAPRFQAVPVLYRWSPTSSWQTAPDARVVLKAPAPGDYALEAAFSGLGNPSVVSLPFRVGPAATPWATWWPLALLPLPLLWLGWRHQEWLQYRFHKLLYLAKLRLRTATPPEEDLTGELLLTRYRLGPLYAQGGFACVYRAEDRENPGQPLVIKVLNRTGTAKEELRRRFSQEAAALGSVSHPNIPPLLDSFVTPQGAPALVLPFYAGLSLRELVRQQAPLAPSRIADLIEQIGSALLELHRKGLVHRDIKPDNILITESNQAMLIDFGTATARGPVGEVDQTGTITGSMHYMAPERLLGQFTPASDVFSLAVVALECLTGLRPAQLPLSPQDPAFPDSVATWMDRPTAELLMEALRHQPDRRPEDFAGWLTRLVERLRAANSSI